MNKNLVLDYPASSMAIIVGNTRAFWPFFQAWCARCDKVPQNPVDTYTAEVVCAAVAGMDTRAAMYWAEDTEPDKLIAMNRAGTASGQVFTCPISHLSVHPVFGPWIAYRAFLVFPDVRALEENYAVLDNFIPSEGQTAIQTAMDTALKDASTWTHWLDVRLKVGKWVGNVHQYSDGQIEYHYTQNPDCIQQQ